MRYDLTVIGGDQLGIDAAMEAAVDGERVIVIASLGETTAERLELFGIDLVPGTARFVGENAILVNGRDGRRRIEACRFVIATGTRPWRPGWIPFDGERILTTRDRMPANGTTLVMGGGALGLRTAIRMASHGLEVTVVEGPEAGVEVADDADVVELLNSADALGVRLELGSEAIGVDRVGDTATVTLRDGRRFTANTLVCAAGPQGNTEGLDLPRIGIHADERGRLWCDAEGRTWLPNVSAVGDVVGHRTTTGAETEAADSIEPAAPRLRVVPAPHRNFAIGSPPLATVNGRPVGE